MITFIARLIRKSDGVTHSAEFDAHPDQASALIAAYERFGSEHQIKTIYPKDEHRRVNWDPNPMRAAAAGPVEVDDDYDPDFDDCRWDGERIEATKSCCSMSI